MDYDHVIYMRDEIATKLQSIQHVEGDESRRHFFRVSSIANMEEVIQYLTDMEGYALIVEDMLMGRFIDNDSNNLLNNKSNVFMLVKQADLADADSRATAISDCEAECMKIFSKMFRDKIIDYKPQQGVKTGLRNLDRNSIYYQTVGPLGDNFHGLMYTYNVMPPLADKVVYNEADWLPDVIS